MHVRAAGFGLDSHHVDGNDVMAVHAVTQRAAARIREGGGTALIEAQTYRRVVTAVRMIPSATGVQMSSTSGS